MKLTPRTFAWLLRRSVIASIDDNCFAIAKGAAYSSLLSFFPVLTSAAAILVQTRAEFVRGQLELALKEILPADAQDLVLEKLHGGGDRHLAVLAAAGLVSLWAAASVVKSLIEGFQAAYRVPRNRDFFHGSAIAVMLVLLAAVPLICASLLILFGGQVEAAVLNWINVDPRFTPLAWVWELLSRITRYAVSFAATVTVTATLYYFGPNRRQRWRYVWPGAILATILWLLTTSGFAWYVTHIGHYNLMYGSIGAGIALLVWMYLMAAITLIGCEFNAEYERAAR